MTKIDEKLKKQGAAEAKELETYPLSPEQERALELLLSGKNITAAAAAAGLARQTVSGWVNHDPIFIAAYNRRRGQFVEWFADRLRSLAETAFKVVEEEMAEGCPDRLDAAKIVLRTFCALGPPPYLFTPQAVETMQRREALVTMMG